MNFYIINHFNSILIPIIISFIIFLTDFFDGKLARSTGWTSKIGAIFDVAADLLYIVVSYIVLYALHIIPLWFLFIIVFKFMEFIITSYYIKNSSDEKPVFVFDILGRFTAVIFYIIPLVSYVFFHFLSNGYLYIVDFIMYITTLLTVISSSYRIKVCVKKFKSNKAPFKIKELD